MSLNIKFLAIVFSVGLVSSAAQADTDVVGTLNAALAAKGVMVTRTREKTREVVRCWFEGLDGRPHRECQTFSEPYTESFVDNARVAAVQIQTIAPIQWQEAQLKSLPATALIQRLTYQNCGADTFSTSYTLGVKGVHSNSVAKTHSVSIKTGLSLKETFKADAGLFGGTTEIGVSLEITTSDSTTSTEQTSNEEDRSWVVSISPAPGHAGYLQLLAIQQTVAVPFSTTLVVDADMESNISGFSKVSQLLSVAERTLPFDGTVTASQLSDSFVGNFKPDVPFKCDAASKNPSVTAVKANYSFPLAALPDQFRKHFGKRKTFHEAMKIQASEPKLSDEQVQEQSPVVSTEVLALDPRCGFDDNGQPKISIHSVEIGNYLKVENGAAIKQFDEFFDKFNRCKE
jgi:hypothetical protein